MVVKFKTMQYRFLTALLSLCILISSCNAPSNLPNHKTYRQIIGFTMGTTYQITVESTLEEQLELKQKIDLRLEKINLLMSTYINTSELSLFNQKQTETCVLMSPETLFVIRKAIDISNQTRGKFDITLDPLIKEWGFDSKQTNDHVPNQKVIFKLLENIGYSKIMIKKRCISKLNKSLSINLSAIAKGYGVDQIANLIESIGVKNYLVEIGGETASRGLNSKSQAWRLAIEAPIEEARQIQKVFQPLGLGVATSGSYRNYFEKDGKRYSHTIDPTTGYPITHNLASVTVLHPETMMADAYATAFMVMGAEEALVFAEKNHLAIYLLIKSKDGFIEQQSSKFSRHIYLD